MISTDRAIALVNGVFEEEALVLGGLAATGGVSDDAVWQMVRSLDVIRGRALRQLRDLAVEPEGAAYFAGGVDAHPAILEFLNRLGKESTERPYAGVAP